MGALVQTMVGDLIPFARRARASGVISAAFSLSTVAGVPLSLWLAEYFQWRAPFVFIAVLVVLFILIGVRVLPELRQHIDPASAGSGQASTSSSVLSGAEEPGQVKHTHPFVAMFAVLRDANHLRALLFSALIIFSGFTVIPYITIYAVYNVGIAQQDIPYVYLLGGAATLISARRIGHWADLRGKVKIYRLVAAAALLPLLVVTHIGAVPLWLWLVCTTTFFVLVSGRMIPAMAIITSAAQPRLRGTFMSLNGTVQAFAMGLATTLSGFIITQDASGKVADYATVGYVAIAANALAIWFATRIAMHEQHAVLDVAPK
jgi:predicted MFS family arabinose efflux permease